MFTKYADCHIEGFCKSSVGRTAATHHVGSFDYTPNDDGHYLYVAVRACTGDVPNLNYDMLPSEELKTAYKSFMGSSVFLNHKNSDPEDARGAIVDAKWHDEDPDDEWVEILMEMDEDRCPKLCKLIKSGEIDTVSMGCFVPGTLVTMSDGTTKTIETVVEGDRVLTLDGSVGDVSYVMSHQHDGLIYEIGSYAQGRPMRLTEEHPVWVRRPQRGEYDTVRGRIEKNNGDGVHVCTCGRKFISHRSLAAHLREEKLKGHESEHGFVPEFDGWVNAADVQIGDYVLDPAIKNSEECDRALARLLGYYLAEGNFGYDKKRKLDEGVPSFVEWTFNENETEYHAEVMRLVRELGYSPVGPYYKNGAATVRCNSPELADIMLRLGGKYSWGKHVSEDVMHWDVDAQRDLLEAYFNGDAHWKDGAHCAHFEFATVSSQLAEQIQAMCTRCGIRCSEPRVSTSAQERLGNRPVYYAQGNFEAAPEGGTSLLAYIDEQGMWRRVTSIRVLEYHGLVYNFEVADSHSYVAEGCAVHNCSVRDTRCSICGNVAEFPFEYCEHVQQKGREFQGKLAYEICNGIDFFECSWVYDPADPTAHTVELLDEGKKVAKIASLELVYEDEYLGRPYRISFQDASKPYVWNVYGVTRGSGATYSEAQADAAARAFIESIPPDDGSDYQRQDGPTSDELYKDTDMEQWDIDLHESKKVAGLSRERPRFDEYRVQGVFDDGTRWCETTLWYRQWDDDEMPSSPEEWGEDVTICDDGSGTLAVIYADDQVAYFDGSAYMYPQGDAMDFDKALDDERLAHDVLVESSKYDEMISGEDVKVAQAAEVWSCSGVYSNGTISGGGPAGGHFDNSFGNWLPNDPVETEDCYGGFTLNLNGTPVVEFDSDMEDVSEYVDGVEGRDISGVVAECVESKADEVIEFMKDWSWYVEDDERDKRHFWEQYFKDAADNSSDGGKWTAKITNMDALPDLPTSEVTAGRKSLPGLEQWQTNDDGSYSFHSGSPKLDFVVYDRGDGRWLAGCDNDYGECMYWIADSLAFERGFGSAQECYERLNQEFMDNGRDIHIRDYY
jgi:hypothetical protein